MILDELAQLPSEERRLYFEQAATRTGRLTAQLYEKDFWVCWILRRVFGLQELGAHLTFKGGTSLSKVFQAIERFSEDIDLSIERDFLGFGGANDPEQGQSGKEVGRRLDALKAACQEAVATRLFPSLQAAIESQLATNQHWSLRLDSNDPDSQTILYEYPQGVTSDMSPYFASTIKLELGARSDHFPVEQADVSPYLAEAIPDVISEHLVHVRVLAGERTFWEKATILHATAHQPQAKPLQLRLSRHYSDLFQLANHPLGEAALNRLDLLERVAEHKQIFFKSAAAQYDKARPGSLRLIPDEDRIEELRQDFSNIQPMFFMAPPDFETLMSELRILEDRINSISK